MKKSLFFLTFFIAYITTWISPASSLAVSTCPQVTPFKALCDIKVGDDTPLIGNLISLLLFIAVVLALIFIIYGGIRWITSGGDKAKLDAARNTITAAVVGLILAFLAFFIISIVSFLFGVSNPTNISIPKLT